jgi:cell division protease FtsH
VEQCHQRALALLQENRWRLDNLAQRLLEKETLDEQEIYETAGLHRSPATTSTNTSTSNTSTTAT